MTTTTSAFISVSISRSHHRTAVETLTTTASSQAAFCKDAVSRRRTGNTKLYYKENNSEDGGVSRSRQQKQEQQEQKQQQQKQQKVLSIPILGPLVRVPPLLPCGEVYTLKDPTPMQWQSILTALNHQDKLDVSASPIIALLDEYTGKGTVQDQGRYATIVAIVGFSTTTNNEEYDDDSITSNDNTKFMKKFNNIQNLKDVKLLSIGRAVVTDFFYQSANQDKYDDDGNMILGNNDNINNKYYSDEEDDDSIHETDVTDNIIMAHFQLVNDSTMTSQKTHSSPVHALSTLSQHQFLLNSLHEERKSLVAKIRAGQARLNRAKQLIQQQQENDDILEDHDGFGLLFESKLREINEDSYDEDLNDDQPVIDQLLQEFGGGTNDVNAAATAEEESSNSSSTSIDNNPLVQLENYGLGVSASAVSTLVACTETAIKKLKPYYSTTKLSSEEFFYEIYSFITLQALSHYLTSEHIAYGVRCTNTNERLQITITWMQAHINALKQYAYNLVQELQNCGDECTDIF